MAKIRAGGFKTSAEGRRGKGVYFWRNDEYAVKVAYVWYLEAKKRGVYRGDDKLACAMIESTLECLPENYLDLESIEISKFIIQIVAAQKLTQYEAQSNKRLTKLYEVVIQKVEKDSKHRFHLLKCSFAVPGLSKCDWYPFGAIGNPTALMVRDLSVIKDIRTRLYEEDENGSGISEYISTGR